MHRKLTIGLEEAVYEGLYRTVGKRRISRFIEDLVTVGGQRNKAMADQIMAADKSRLKSQLEVLSTAGMRAVEDAV